MYYLKKIGWYLDFEGHLYVYKGNPYLEKEIKTSNNVKVFGFIQSFKDYETKEALHDNNNNLSEEEFNDIFEFFLSQNWIYEAEPVNDKEIRLRNFVDCVPGLNYTRYHEVINQKQILILGLGTGGSYLLETLIKLGFNNFVLIDGDVVEKKNLTAQNYSEADIGKAKVTVQKLRYEDDQVKIAAFKEELLSYEALLKLVDLDQINYFINCADDFKLQKRLMQHLFIDYPDLKMTYGGYSFLIHSDTLITEQNYLKLLDKAMAEEKLVNSKYYISENSGSIFNGFLSAFAIAKIIFNDVVGADEKGTFVGNLFDDQYNFS